MMAIQQFLPALAISLSLLPLAAEEKPSGPIVVQFPLGDVRIRYVEAGSGMMLLAESQSVSIKAKRLHFGDGERVVTYEATQSGFITPAGRTRAASVTIRNATPIRVKRGKLKDWVPRSGEVFIQLPNIRFTEVD